MCVCVLCLQGVTGGKRKARSEVEEEGVAAGKPAGQTRKAVKRAQGHTPSRRGGNVPPQRGQSPAGKGLGTPLRHLNGAKGVQGGVSRLAQSTHATDIENAAKAANGTPAAAQVIFLFASLLISIKDICSRGPHMTSPFSSRSAARPSVDCLSLIPYEDAPRHFVSLA